MSEDNPEDKRRGTEQNPLLPVPPGEDAIVDRPENERKKAEKYQTERNDALGKLREVSSDVRRAVNHTIISNYIMCALTAAMILVTVRQCSVTGDQLREMERATTVADTNAKAAVRAAKAAEDAVTKAQDSAHIDQRAWLGVKTDFKQPAIGEHITANLVVSNIGKSPAVKTRFVGYISVGPTRFTKYVEIEKIGKFPQDSIDSNVTIFPTADYTVVLATALKITVEGEIRGINEGVNVIHIGGSVTYEDIFGNAHFTHFFGVYSPKTRGFDAQQDHNDAN